MDLGTERTFFTPTGALPGQPPFGEDIRQKIQVAKNYKFDWGPSPEDIDRITAST